MTQCQEAKAPGRARQSLEDEMEQLRTAAEDAREEASALARERDSLASELSRRTNELRAIETRLSRREQAAGTARTLFSERIHAAAELTGSTKANEELRVAVEELQVFAEELAEANTALSLANAEMEHRVAERTAELAALNERLRDNEQRLQLAQRHAGAGAWDWDIRAGQLTWSAEYFELYGFDKARVHPLREIWLSAILDEDRPQVESALRECLDNCQADFRTEYRIRHPARGERWIATRSRLVCDDFSSPVRLIGLDFDITDRKLSEIAVAEANARLREELGKEIEAREAAQARLFQTMKLEAIGQLTGGVAHDFNNLLSVIISSAGLLRRTDDPARRARLLNTLEQAAERGADLTRRLLTFSRRQALRPEPLDTASWLHDVQELLARSLREDIKIEIAARDDLWPMLVDRGELELAVLNVAVNARDAMPRGGRLRLSGENVELDPVADPDRLSGSFVRLRIEDTGTGMTPEILARVFEPFYSTKETGQGTGLGLAQVYGFARQSGGAARICSAPGSGTAVSLLIPRAAVSPEHRGQSVQPVMAGAARRAASGLKVVLVEDDPDVAELTGEMLHQLGHEVVRFASAATALDALRSGTEADLLLTDVVMPGGEDGLDLALKLAKERPDLPVLLCSGYGGSPARVAESGLPLLHKPFHMHQLWEAVDSAIRNKQRQRADVGSG